MVILPGYTANKRLGSTLKTLDRGRRAYRFPESRWHDGHSRLRSGKCRYRLSRRKPHWVQNALSPAFQEGFPQAVQHGPCTAPQSGHFRT